MKSQLLKNPSVRKFKDTALLQQNPKPCPDVIRVGRSKQKLHLEYTEDVTYDGKNPAYKTNAVRCHVHVHVNM